MPYQKYDRAIIYMSIFQLQQMRNLSSSEEEGNDLTLQEITEGPGIVNYGNLIVCSKEKMHISIGPDYPFTICATIFLCVISYALLMFERILSFGIFGKTINIFFVLLPPISFLYTALSNPGIYNCYENDEPKIKYCQACKVFKPKKVFHCNTCNVCIQGYDHHCPWISKCVGKKNLVPFYVFIISIPSSFFYFGFLMFTAMSAKTQQ